MRGDQLWRPRDWARVAQPMRACRALMFLGCLAMGHMLWRSRSAAPICPALHGDCLSSLSSSTRSYFLWLVKLAPSVALRYCPCHPLSPPLGALIHPCPAQFSCHLCKEASFDHLLSDAPSHITWSFFLFALNTTTGNCWFVCFLTTPYPHHWKVSLLSTETWSILVSAISLVPTTAPGT